MTDEELVKQLRDEALDLHRSAWRDISGGQNATISATLADTTADRIEQLTAELDELVQTSAILCDDCGWAMKFPDLGCVYCGLYRLEKERDALTAESDRLRAAIDYILDGMGIAEPDYDIDPDDDFLDAANSEWVRDTLTRLAAALKGESHE